MNWKLLIYILIVYFSMCALIFLFQRNLLYLPSGSPINEESAKEIGLRTWPSSGGDLGFTNYREPVDPDGTVIVFHGNAGAAYHRYYYIKALEQHNLRVVLAEYPGYGGRPGGMSEVDFVKDALVTIDLAHEMYGEPLYLWGESLGAGIASSAVKQTSVPIKGLVLFTPWDTLPNLAQAHYWYLPARWLVLDQYDNVDNLAGFEGNIAVVLAGEDEVVPVRLGKTLYESITANKKLWLFEGTRHNEMPLYPGLPWWDEVVRFISGGDESPR